jgi:hypothetical protein
LGRFREAKRPEKPAAVIVAGLPPSPTPKVVYRESAKYDSINPRDALSTDAHYLYLSDGIVDI